MRHLLIASASALAMLTAFNALADARQADDHAPIGVMGDHLHRQGEWMLAYHYDHTRSEGLRSGSRNVSAISVLGPYNEVHLSMDMDMHMLEIMYGINDDFTLMVMPHFMTMSMTHYTDHGGGHSHTHETSGFGDTQLLGLYSLFRGEHRRAHLNMGVSVPTGAADTTFLDHHNTRYPAAYNMQFGSGTFDPILGATYVAEYPGWSMGAQTINTLRLYNNAENYRQGHKFTATAWASRNVSDNASLSLRLAGETWGNVEGRNSGLPLNAVAGADPDEQAGSRVSAYAGLNLLAGKELGALSGHRLAVEFGLPLYEHYSGPQLKTDYRLRLGWQAAF